MAEDKGVYEKMSETNIKRIFKEKPDTMFKDIHGGASFTVNELNEMWLKPTMQMSPDPNSKEMKEIEIFLGRYEKE